MKNHLIFLKTRTLTVHVTEFVRDFSTLRLCIMITFSAPTRRHSIFISAAAWLLTIDSWSGTLNLSGNLIAGCSELPKSFPGASPQSRSETIFSDPSIYSPQSIQVISFGRIGVWDVMMGRLVEFCSWKVGLISFCKLCHRLECIFFRS